MELLKDKDADAFEKIFSAYRDIVYYECIKRIRNVADANDCVQEIFIRLVDKIECFNPRIADFNAWFRTLYLNYINDFCRKIKVYNSKFVNINYEEAIELPENESTNKANEEFEQMDKIVSIVGEVAYDILVYKYKYNMSIRQIAEHLNMNFYQVRKILIEAKETLNKEIK